ncbi:MAG TPA: CBS domain-containing protein [Telmatospirillum sp.]|nr:CBS domain-containing protein [Telmatospirillum sp.]
MNRSSPKADDAPKSILAERHAIGHAHHPRVAEPTVRSLLAKRQDEVPVVGEDAMVLDALAVMTECDSGAVVVLSESGLAGLFSERDHARNCLLGNRTASNTPVTDLMTRALDFATPAQSVADCLALMTEKRLTHIPVFDQGKLVGLLSRSDLLEARLAFHERVFHETELDQKLLFLRGTYSC